MEDKDFAERIAYSGACLEALLHVENTYPLWMVTKYGNLSVFDIPKMPLVSFSDELVIPDMEKPFTISLAFFSKRCLPAFVDIIRYRLDHPYNVLNSFDEAVYAQVSDILSDVLFDWYYTKDKIKDEFLFDVYNKAYELKMFRNAAVTLLKEFYKNKDAYGNMFIKFCNQKMETRLLEFWFGFSLVFSQGLRGTSKFKLMFVTEKGKEVLTDPLLFTDWVVFNDKLTYEKNLRGLFSGIFPKTNYPVSKEKGLDIWSTNKTKMKIV